MLLSSDSYFVKSYTLANESTEACHVICNSRQRACLRRKFCQMIHGCGASVAESYNKKDSTSQELFAKTSLVCDCLYFSSLLDRFCMQLEVW